MVTDATLKQLMLADDTHIDITITVSNDENTVIRNEQIYFESMTINEGICNDSQLSFGTCPSTEFSIQVADIDDSIVGCDISVLLRFSDSSGSNSKNYTLGRYVISKCEKTADKRFTIITAYDYMQKFDMEIADWWNTTLYPTEETVRTISEILRMLCRKIGVSYTAPTFINDISIPYNSKPSSLSARTLLSKICELNLMYARFDYTTLKFIKLADNSVGNITTYKDCSFEDYIVSAINQVIIKSENGDIGYQTNTPANPNPFTISGNFLLYGLDATQLGTIANRILNNIGNYTYTPSSIKIRGGMCYELGDKLTFTTSQGTFTSYVLNRSMQGIQGLTTAIECRGDKDRSDTESSMSISDQIDLINGKASSLKKDVDSLELKFSDYSTTEQMQSAITQTATQISTEVVKGVKVGGRNYLLNSLTLAGDYIAEFLIDENGNQLIDENNANLFN